MYGLRISTNGCSHAGDMRDFTANVARRRSQCVLTFNQAVRILSFRCINFSSASAYIRIFARRMMLRDDQRNVSKSYCRVKQMIKEAERLPTAFLSKHFCGLPNHNCNRNVIKRSSAWLKQFKRIANYYNKPSFRFGLFLVISTSVI